MSVSQYGIEIHTSTGRETSPVYDYTPRAGNKLNCVQAPQLA